MNKAGGALLDLNVYNIHFVVTGLVWGTVGALHYYPNMERGVDTSGILILEYPAFQCACIGGQRTARRRCRSISRATRAASSATPTLSRFEEFSYQENKKESVPLRARGYAERSVFYDELRAFADYWVRDDRAEFQKRLEQSLIVMKVLDRARGIA